MSECVLAWHCARKDSQALASTRAAGERDVREPELHVGGIARGAVGAVRRLDAHVREGVQLAEAVRRKDGAAAVEWHPERSAVGRADAGRAAVARHAARAADRVDVRRELLQAASALGVLLRPGATRPGGQQSGRAARQQHGSRSAH